MRLSTGMRIGAALDAAASLVGSLAAASEFWKDNLVNGAVWIAVAIVWVCVALEKVREARRWERIEALMTETRRSGRDEALIRALPGEG